MEKEGIRGRPPTQGWPACGRLAPWARVQAPRRGLVRKHIVYNSCMPAALGKEKPGRCPGLHARPPSNTNTWLPPRTEFTMRSCTGATAAARTRKKIVWAPRFAPRRKCHSPWLWRLVSGHGHDREIRTGEALWESSYSSCWRVRLLGVTKTRTPRTLLQPPVGLT